MSSSHAVLLDTIFYLNHEGSSDSFMIEKLIICAHTYGRPFINALNKEYIHSIISDVEIEYILILLCDQPEHTAQFSRLFFEIIDIEKNLHGYSPLKGMQRYTNMIKQIIHCLHVIYPLLKKSEDRQMIRNFSWKMENTWCLLMGQTITNMIFEDGVRRPESSYTPFGRIQMMDLVEDVFLHPEEYPMRTEFWNAPPVDLIMAGLEEYVWVRPFPSIKFPRPILPVAPQHEPMTVMAQLPEGYTAPQGSWVSQHARRPEGQPWLSEQVDHRGRQPWLSEQVDHRGRPRPRIGGDPSSAFTFLRPPRRVAFGEAQIHEIPARPLCHVIVVTTPMAPRKKSRHRIEVEEAKPLWESLAFLSPYQPWLSEQVDHRGRDTTALMGSLIASGEDVNV